MRDEFDSVLEQLGRYHSSILNLDRFSSKERRHEIESLGESLKQLSKMNIPELDDKEHDPFSGAILSINTSETQKDRERYNEEYDQ